MAAAGFPWRTLPGPFGAELAGLDARTLDPGALLQLAAERQLLVVRDQQFVPETLQAFAATLGELDVYPYAEAVPGAPYVVTIVKNPEDVDNFGGAWHSDTTYLPQPPAFTLLYAVEVPAAGGDTLYADMCGAYAALSQPLRDWLDTLVGHNVSGMVHERDGAHASVTGGSTPRREAAAASADHPVVRVHPQTGRRALFLSLIHTERFVGMTPEESLPMIAFLQAFAVRPERCVRLGWRPGTLAIWDNRSLQHNPLNDYHGQRREMHRVLLKGERPLGVTARQSQTPFANASRS